MQTTEISEQKEKTIKKFLDSSYPLLENFREKAPGTYRHCMNVAGICESISSEIGLDVDIIRCAAIYHDIGKMIDPLSFSENQNGSGNIHDKIDPELSYHIISRHVSDGVNMLIQIPDMPREIIEIISQHHGSTILNQFRIKANSDEIDKWRYKCTKPQTTEAAILMISDSTEATARSFYSQGKLDSPEEIKNIVSSTVERLIDDGQLDEMKIGVVKIIKRILNKEIQTLFHKRESYPTDESLKIDKE